MNIGVLALQGSVEEHLEVIARAGDKGVEVRNPDDFENIDALIIPGGESTTILKLLKIKKLDSILTKKIESGIPVWGTCAGLIILSTLGYLDAVITRNGWGSQNFSFTRDTLFNNKSIQVSFIRAPRIKTVGAGVEVLSTLENEIVAIKRANILGTTFHPELGLDLTVYNYFKGLV